MSQYIRKSDWPNDNGMLQVFSKCRRNYELFKLLKQRLFDEYERITKFERTFNGIKYKYSDAQWILLDEYFLWMNQNDHKELRALLTRYADCLAEKLCYYKDIYVYEHDDDPYYKVNTGNISLETKAIVEELLRPAIRECKRKLNQAGQASNAGMFNLFTGEIVKPTDGTYYIDDFR